MPKQRGPLPSPLDKLRQTIDNVVSGESITTPGEAEGEPAKRSDVQMFDSPGVQVSERSDVQTFNMPDVQTAKRSGVQQFKRPAIQTAKRLHATRRNSSGLEPQTVYLSPDLRRWLKAHAALSGREISEIIEELVQDYKAAQEEG